MNGILPNLLKFRSVLIQDFILKWIGESLAMKIGSEVRTLQIELESFPIIRYINEDTSIVPMIKMLRDSGHSTFLVTNRPGDLFVWSAMPVYRDDERDQKYHMYSMWMK
ncbi:hypothetical protein L1049_018610 [Liquidambar formosana]|uniref:Uncharacterized protein n=1 Tax=Liquidambar formosana TaxID=63359 RepID=A0AAP0RAY0_LIQFO